MAAKHGIALLLAPHDGGEEGHEGGDYEPGAEEEDAARAFYEAGEKGDWKAAAKALCALIDMHQGDEAGEDEEHEGGEEG